MTTESGSGASGTEARHSPVEAASTGRFLGDFVAWEFGAGEHEFSSPRDQVHAVFEAHGFGDCIEAGEEDPGTALLRANRVGGIVRGRGIVVEPMERPNKDTPAAIAVYKKQTVEGETGDKIAPGARVRIDPATNRAVALPLEGSTTCEPQCLKVAEQIADRCNEILSNVKNKELSVALCLAGRSLYWAPFRRKVGGAYFVFAAQAPRWRALTDDLEKLGGFLATVQPLFVDGDGRSERNVARASEAAIEHEFAELVAELEDMKTRRVRQDSIDTQVAKCQELLIRSNLYRESLKERVTTIEARAAALRAEFQALLNPAPSDSVFVGIDEALKEVPAVVVPKVKRGSRSPRRHPS